MKRSHDGWPKQEGRDIFHWQIRSLLCLLSWPPFQRSWKGDQKLWLLMVIDGFRSFFWQRNAIMDFLVAAHAVYFKKSDQEILIFHPSYVSFRPISKMSKYLVLAIGGEARRLCWCGTKTIQWSVVRPHLSSIPNLVLSHPAQWGERCVVGRC